MLNYINKIKDLQEPTFQKIRRIANKSISNLSKREKNKLWKDLERGVKLLDSHEEMCQYLWAFGNMHEEKIHYAVANLPDELFDTPFEIIDWGCGQGLATICFIDYLKNKGFDIANIEKVTLVEPSKAALERACLHTEAYIDSKRIKTINSFFEDIEKDKIIVTGNKPVIHFFSNILDVIQIDIKNLARKLCDTISADNYLVTVGPVNSMNRRIDLFYDYFQNKELLHEQTISQFRIEKGKDWTYKGKVFKLMYSDEGNLIPVEFYLPATFFAGYVLDSVKASLPEKLPETHNSITAFDLAAPFDVGASIYDDIDPVLAVLNNIITRGLPTRSSVKIEEKFKDAFNVSNKVIKYGEIIYVKNRDIDVSAIAQWTENVLKSNGRIDFSNVDKELLQILYSPIAIARIQKTIIESLLTGKLDISKKEWKVLIEEQDVPCGAMAIQELREIHNKLTALSQDFSDRQFPEVNLVVVSNEEFVNSPLHYDHKPFVKVPTAISEQEYDLVIDIAVFEKSKITKESFSKYRALNKCYFNIRSLEYTGKTRSIYTTDLITYKPLVKTNNSGVHTEIEKHRELLEYFLQLIFRKEHFRAGQLPILNRALQNKSVIGLLPTGGGKSLTYQLAAMLQPGVTLIVDPLKSLMKDQYDGLMNAGIDSCDFINSSLSYKEKEDVMNRMERSQLQFIFMSPERLAIFKFRKRLKNMSQLNIYFSYGVIDEVHCVSEWGHDFRFLYLHLGRNMYNYVKPKSGNISLFGLTATASFDVLADVERELSGDGAFDLDADTIVRYENTNRLELQYKIEKVQVKLKDEIQYLRDLQRSQNKDYSNSISQLESKYKALLDYNLPLPIKVADKWSYYRRKNNFLENYITKIPKYIKELQTKKSLERIIHRFAERQNLDEEAAADLTTEMPENFYKKSDHYDQAGIVFCPHKNSTGVSVKENVKVLRPFINDVGMFYGNNDDDEEDTNESMGNLEAFRNNRQPVMVATKAFGMGIDKPNVRFTVNMNYSGSLESFVQEAGRAGRDRKMALSVILVSDYKLVRINPQCRISQPPVGVIKGRWFIPKDLEQILNFYNIHVEEQYLDYMTPNNDMVRLVCNEGQGTKYWGFFNCQDHSCKLRSKCDLRKLPGEFSGWIYEKDLMEELRKRGLKIPKKHYQYQSADYDTMMYFYNNNFKGELAEKKVMVNLLNTKKIEYVIEEDIGGEFNTKTVNGFLETLLSRNEDKTVVSFISYHGEESADIAKAIYRMTSIGLIDDFTQDYGKERFRIVSKRKKEGGYYESLKRFLLRYYTEERADDEIEKAKKYEISDSGNGIRNEIYRCLAYLTDFVYEKISEKRKRAIDDMRTFCVTGGEEARDWKEVNEELKDFIFYYFNSKYAKDDYVADNNEPYSLTSDTEEGKVSAEWIVFKFLKVTEPEIVGIGTEIDNVKHLQGAVRLLRRSLTDDNPALSLLDAFCILFLGTKNNENLERELETTYREGMYGFYERIAEPERFWNLFNEFNQKVKRFDAQNKLKQLTAEASLLIHNKELNKITEKYLEE